MCVSGCVSSCEEVYFMRIHARDQACEERVGHERWNQVHAAARAGDKGIAKYMRRRARGGGTSIAK